MNTTKGGADLQRLSPLEKAIEYIEEHLDENIGLSDVSRATGYSYYHMTRLFSSVLGESVGRYINRRRLYNASKKLIHTDQRVIDIALDEGFESPEAFSRAFKVAFGSSPMDYRKAGLDLVMGAKRELAPEDVEHIANNISRFPQIVWQEEIKLAGIRGNTSLFDNRLPELWEQFQCFQKKCKDGHCTGYGVCETQRTTYTKDGDLSFSALVGSPVSCFDRLPPTLVEKTICAGKYAVFTHRGTFANFAKTYQYIFETWLSQTKEVLDERDDFEVYEREVVSFDDPNNEVKIFIPVK